MGVLEQNQCRSRARLGPDDLDQHPHGVLLDQLRRKQNRAVALLVRDREQRCDKRHVAFGEAEPVDQKRLELVQSGFRIHVANREQRPLEGRADGIEGAVGEERRALKQLGLAGFVLQPLAQRTDHPALADTGFAAQHHRPPGPGRVHLPPAVDQRRDFGFAPDDRRQNTLGRRLEAAFRVADAQYAVDLRGAADTLQLLLSQVLILKSAARHPAHAFAHNNGPWFGDRLKPGSKVHGFAERVSFAGGNDNDA